MAMHILSFGVIIPKLLSCSFESGKHILLPRDLLTLKLCNRAIKMLKKFVINLEDKMNRDILRLRESSCKLKEGLSDPKKVPNLAPFLMIKQ
jgi:hypothetical protein